MADLMDLIKQEAKNRNLSFLEPVVPYYVSIIGAHIFNTYNHVKSYYQIGGITPKMNLQFINVCPMDLGKIYHDFFFNSFYSIFGNTQIPLHSKPTVNTKSFLDLISDNYKSLVIVDNLTGMILQRSSPHSQIQMCLSSVLDSGILINDVKGTEQNIYSSLIGNAEPSCFPTDGIFKGKFLLHLATPQDDFYGQNKTTHNLDNLKKIQDLINRRNNEIFNSLNQVKFSKKYDDFMAKNDFTFSEMEMYDKLAIGYWIWKIGEIPDTLVISLDDELKDMILKLYQDQLALHSDPTTAVSWNYLKHGVKVNRKKFIQRMLDFGFKISSINRSLRKLYNRNLIKSFNAEIIEVTDEKYAMEIL